MLPTTHPPAAPVRRFPGWRSPPISSKKIAGHACQTTISACFIYEIVAWQARAAIFFGVFPRAGLAPSSAKRGKAGMGAGGGGSRGSVVSEVTLAPTPALPRAAQEGAKPRLRAHLLLPSPAWGLSQKRPNIYSRSG